MVARSLLTVLMLTASAMFFAPFASAQGSDTVFDEAGALSAAEERDVQAAFNQASAESGDPLYAFLEPDTNVASDNLNAQHEFLLDRVQQADLPADVGVIVVAPDERWSQVQNLSGNTEQDVYGAMVPYFQDGDFAQGLVAGATQYQDSLSVLPELLTTGGVLATLTALAGGALLLFNRRRKERELEEQRRLVEREFAALTERMDAFGEKERLVAGYLEAQRPLLDQKNEEEVEAKIRDARSAGFGREFNEAASHLASDPGSAREKIASGRRLLDKALSNLVEAESTIDQYRAADEALEGMLRVAAEEIDAAETAERSARETGASVEYQDLRRKYDRLAKETANRTGRRDEFDPRETLAAVGALIEKARDRRTAMEAEVSARAILPEERSLAKDALLRARETLKEYARAYATATNGWGPAALEEAPAPEELSADLRDASGCVERSGTAEAAGRFVEARSLLEGAAQTARVTMQAPSALKEVVAEADRRRREGEEKLAKLEARLEHAKANRHRMGPRQKRQLRDYERRLDDARGGFFGTDWLTALLVFEALDTDYMYVDSPGGDFGDGGWADGGDWGGGDWGGDFGGGDFGGGDFGGGF
jgi:uncharacterized membrane protein YgcG